MPSDDTLRRIKAIQSKVEEVGAVLGIPHDQAAALVIVDVLEQNQQVQTKATSKRMKKILDAISHGFGIFKSEVTKED